MTLSILTQLSITMIMGSAPLLGCNSAEECIPPECGTPLAKTIDQCATGGFFANCGGEGQPTLGCNAATEDCRWFTTGTVAEGYTSSSCSHEDICCEDDQPFTSSDFAFANKHLEFWGYEPWDETRSMTLGVTISDNLLYEALSCSGEDNLGVLSPCSEGATVSHDDQAIAELRDTLIVTMPFEGIAGWTPIIEIDPQTNKARVCTGRYTDTIAPRCSGSAYLCAESGSVELSESISEGMSNTPLVRITANFGEFTLSGTIQVVSMLP